MTLLTTNKMNIKNFKKKYYNEKFFIFLFSFLPVSLIWGNTAINLNILIIDILFLFTCYHRKKWSFVEDKYFYFFIFFWIYLIVNSAFLAHEIPSEHSGIDEITQQMVFPEKESIARSLGFIRYIIFLFAVQYFLVYPKKILDRIFLYWSIRNNVYEPFI